jgi:hypothetical protein
MGQYLRTNGDYNIKTTDGGIITLDTGTNVGFVKITGNLIVEGETLTVAATDLNVEDNIITVNFGETGAGISRPGGLSGLQVDRGSLPPASFLFDEASDAWIITEGAAPFGPFSYENSALRVNTIKTAATPLNPNANLTLIGTGVGVVTVDGTLNYDQQVITYGDNAIPNKKYVDDAIFNNPTFQIRSGDTRVIIGDSGVPGSVDTHDSIVDRDLVEGQSGISLVVDGLAIAQFYQNRLELGQLEINNNFEITTRFGITNENIIVRTQGTGKLETNYGLQLTVHSATPTAISGSTILYSNSPKAGTTGLFYAHSDRNSDDEELVSKNRALLFSMLF